MNAPARLGLFAAGLGVALLGAFGIAAAVVPPEVVTRWEDQAISDDADPQDTTDQEDRQTTEDDVMNEILGLTLSAGGYALSPVEAPSGVEQTGSLAFQVLDAQGEPLTAYETSHERELHLIVVRADGARFEHAHPTLDASTGVWTAPWQWSDAGTYRVFADFVPAGGSGDRVILSRTVTVAGHLETPAPTGEVRVDRVADFDVAVAGDLVAGSASELTFTVSQPGAAPIELQPYLGAFGHLVALRDGDLAYLHVHAEGDAPDAGSTGGPAIAFMAVAPTPDRYRLYLDFQVDGQVYTAEFILDAAAGDTTETSDHDSH